VNEARAHPSKKPGLVQKLLGLTPQPHQAPSPDARVTPDSTRCVQCGVCGYNCPVGIPVRDYARQGLPVTTADCVQCGQCIEVCPRGTLHWGTPAPHPPESSPELDAILRQYFGPGGQDGDRTP
jgi:ferredoxin